MTSVFGIEIPFLPGKDVLTPAMVGVVAALAYMYVPGIMDQVVAERYRR